MTNNDNETIGLPALAWQIGIRENLLREFLYRTVPSNEWPSSRPVGMRRWEFNPEEAQAIRDHYADVPVESRVRYFLPDGDKMYDIAWDLSSTGQVVLSPTDDVAEIMRELIYDHDLPMTLHSRNHLGTILKMDSI